MSRLGAFAPAVGFVILATATAAPLTASTPATAGLGQPSLLGTTCDGVPATITGTNASELIAGTAGNDVIVAGGGNDTISALDGNDRICGGTGNDNVIAGDGNDRLFGDDGNDVLLGGNDDDRIDGGVGADTASFAFSPDAVTAIVRGPAFGSASGEGSDTLIRIENLTGASGNDQLRGDEGANVLSGGRGFDRVEARGGDDLLHGGDGDDNLLGEGGNDRLDGGNGRDRAVFLTSPVAVVVDLDIGNATGDGVDTLGSIENASGSDHDDRLIGNSSPNELNGIIGDDALVGGDGNDVLRGEDGDDTLAGGFDGFPDGQVGDVLSGGAGVDTASYADSLAAVTVNLSLGTARGDGGDHLGGTIENVTGSKFADTLVGSELANRLTGLAGDDRLDGDAGNDTLAGGAGNDALRGRSGNDLLNGARGVDNCRGGTGTDTAITCEIRIAVP